MQTWCCIKGGFHRNGWAGFRFTGAREQGALGEIPWLRISNIHSKVVNCICKLKPIYVPTVIGIVAVKAFSRRKV